MTTDVDLQASPEVLATEGETPEVIEELAPLEPIPQWDKRYKDVFSELGAIPEKGRTYQETFLDYAKEQQGYHTKIEQERARIAREAQDYQQRLGRYDQIVAPHRQVLDMAGMSPEQAMHQGVAILMGLRSDPAGTLRELAQMTRQDLSQLTQDQPYIDPQVKALQDQLNQLQNMTARQQQQAAQEYQQRAFAEISHEIGTFAEAKDDSGNLLHPHLDTVQPLMAELIFGREAQRRNDPSKPSLTLDEAYERACKLSPDIAQAIESEKAVREAAKKSAQAKKESDSAKRVTGKRSGKDVDVGDLEDDILANYRKSQAA